MQRLSDSDHGSPGIIGRAEIAPAFVSLLAFGGRERVEAVVNKC